MDAQIPPESHPVGRKHQYQKKGFPYPMSTVRGDERMDFRGASKYLRTALAAPPC